MTKSEPLIELICAVSQGDRNAGDKLFQLLLLDLINGQVRRRQGGLSAEHRNDMAQTMALWMAEKLVAHSRAFKADIGSPEGYFRRITERLAYRYLRAQAAKKRNFVESGREGDEAESARSQVPSGLDKRVKDELAAAIEDFRNTQSLKNQQTLDLLLNDSTPSEIADELGVSLQAIQQRLSRMKRALLVFLKERGLLILACFLTACFAFFTTADASAAQRAIPTGSSSIVGGP